jgi:hypothetical protein
MGHHRQKKLPMKMAKVGTTRPNQSKSARKPLIGFGSAVGKNQKPASSCASWASMAALEGT